MRKLLPLASLMALTASAASAATLNWYVTSDSPGAAEIAAGVPADAVAYRFYLTSDVDVISVNNIKISVAKGGELFQVPPPFGSNTAPPSPEFLALNPALAFDSWVTTPGSTSLLGPDLPGDGTSTWGDLTDDGPQTGFHFATLTVGRRFFPQLTGRIALNDGGTPQNFDLGFMFGVPEPATFVLAGIGVVGVLAVRRRR